MSLNGFEALAVALLFLAPGALFLYESARYYSPEMRSKYLRRQFPLELTIYYLLSSIAIHSILLFLLSSAILIFSQITRNPDLILEWWNVLAQFPRVSALDFFIILTAGLIYLILALSIAYVGARQLRRHLLLPEPLWCEEMIKVLSQGGRIFVSAVKQQGDLLEGELSDFRYIGEKGKVFEMLLAVKGIHEAPNTTVWFDSGAIREMDMRGPSGNWKFLFASKPRMQQNQGDHDVDL